MRRFLIFLLVVFMAILLYIRFFQPAPPTLTPTQTSTTQPTETAILPISTVWITPTWTLIPPTDTQLPDPTETYTPAPTFTPTLTLTPTSAPTSVYPIQIHKEYECELWIFRGSRVIHYLRCPWWALFASKYADGPFIGSPIYVP